MEERRLGWLGVLRDYESDAQISRHASKCAGNCGSPGLILTLNARKDGKRVIPTRSGQMREGHAFDASAHGEFGELVDRPLPGGRNIHSKKSLTPDARLLRHERLRARLWSEGRGGTLHSLGNRVPILTNRGTSSNDACRYAGNRRADLSRRNLSQTRAPAARS